MARGSDNVVLLRRPPAQESATGGIERTVGTSAAVTSNGEAVPPWSRPAVAPAPMCPAATRATILSFPRGSSAAASAKTVPTRTASLPSPRPSTSPLQAAVVPRGDALPITDAAGHVLTLQGTPIAALSIDEFHFF